MKDALKEESPNHCAPDLKLSIPPSAHSDSKRRFSIDFNIDCEYKCKNQPVQKESLQTQNFNVYQLNLREGDGRLWASTSSALIYWSQEICLDLASSKCGDLSAIEDFRMNKMDSGEWSFDGKLSCDKNQASVTSPLIQRSRLMTGHLLILQSVLKLRRSFIFSGQERSHHLGVVHLLKKEKRTKKNTAQNTSRELFVLEIASLS